jgi:hypothetical protein
MIPVIARPMELSAGYPEVRPRDTGFANATVLINGKMPCREDGFLRVKRTEFVAAMRDKPPDTEVQAPRPLECSAA